MKLAGESRNRLGGGLNVPHIGIAVASSSGDQVASELYETKGHTHLVLAVDRDGNCPVRPNGRPLFGYEIEYTKFFEDSLSRVFAVPIVGLLGARSACRDAGFACNNVFAVGGGSGSLQNVVEAIEGDFPVFVIKGSGRVADLVCAVREHESMAFVKNQCKGSCRSVLQHYFFVLEFLIPFQVIGVEFERLKKCSA